MKKVFVYVDKSRYEIEVDEEIFLDYKLEACTRLVERFFTQKNYNITPFLFCEDVADSENQKDVKFGTYNTYKIIINAGFHILAERMRKIFFKDYKMDLANQPIQSKFDS
jgi:hypothetical protein